MNSALNVCLVMILLVNLWLIGSNRVLKHLSLVSVQGFLLSLVTILVHYKDLSVDTVVIAVMNFFVMALLAPWLLRRAVREVAIQEELVPYLGYVASLLFGLGIIGVSFLFFSNMKFATHSGSAELLPFAMSSVLFGLFMIVLRKKALKQAIGYLMLANGVTLFGIALAAEQPLLVEMGILIDAFFAILVMGIAIYHINQEFDSIDVSRLDSLKDRI